MQVYATVGISGSGKTTWARNYIKKHPNTVLIDTDDLREELLGNASDQSKNELIFSTAFTRMNTALEDYHDVIFCATSLTHRTRNALREAITIPKTKVCFVWFPVNLETCLTRNLMRERQVPEKVIRRQYATMEKFEEDENYMVVIS